MTTHGLHERVVHIGWRFSSTHYWIAAVIHATPASQVDWPRSDYERSWSRFQKSKRMTIWEGGIWADEASWPPSSTCGMPWDWCHSILPPLRMETSVPQASRSFRKRILRAFTYFPSVPEVYVRYSSVHPPWLNSRWKFSACVCCFVFCFDEFGVRDGIARIKDSQMRQEERPQLLQAWDHISRTWSTVLELLDLLLLFFIILATIFLVIRVYTKAAICKGCQYIHLLFRLCHLSFWLFHLPFSPYTYLALQSNSFCTWFHTIFNKASFWSADFKLFNDVKMKQFRRWRIELLMCEVGNVKNKIVRKAEAARNHGPSAVQDSTTKQHLSTCSWILRTHTATHTHDRNWKQPNCSSQWEKSNDVKMKKIGQWRIEILLAEDFGSLKFMDLRDLRLPSYFKHQ